MPTFVLSLKGPLPESLPVIVLAVTLSSAISGAAERSVILWIVS